MRSDSWSGRRCDFRQMMMERLVVQHHHCDSEMNLDENRKPKNSLPLPEEDDSCSCNLQQLLES